MIEVNLWEPSIWWPNAAKVDLSLMSVARVKFYGARSEKEVVREVFRHFSGCYSVVEKEGNAYIAIIRRSIPRG